MSGQFPRRVQHVQPGEPVSAGVTGRATRALEQRTEQLSELLAAATAGKALLLPGQAISSDVLAANAVYWDETLQQYRPALAGASVTENGLTATPAAHCLGLCVNKRSATVGDILIAGAMPLSAALLLQLVGEGATPGLYYLSAVEPGRLVQQRPGVSIPVAYLLGPANSCEADSYVLVSPQFQDLLDSHAHHHFELTALPAGEHTPPVDDDPHVITDADESLPGWLPADHAIFNDRAPAGAAFGYNLSAHPQLQEAWPPIPVEAAVLEVHQPDPALSERIPGLIRVPADLVQMDRYGIWWMTDCQGQVPWPADYDSGSSASSASPLCPINPAMQLLLSFARMTFATSRSVVTRLSPATGSPLRFKNCDNEDATTGDLEASLDLTAVTSETEALGGEVIKSVDSEDLQFHRGWVVEGLVAGSESVVLSGTHTRLLDPEQPAGPENPEVHQGIVNVDVQIDPSTLELHPQIIRLGDAEERELDGVDYIGLPVGQNSAIRLRFQVPFSSLPTSPALRIRLALWSLIAGPFCAVSLSYRRIPRGSPTPSEIPGSDTSGTLDIVTPSAALLADRVLEVDSDEFTVAAGDVVFVTIARSSAASPAFNADIAVLAVLGLVAAGS